MILLLGDIHGNVNALQNAINTAVELNAVAVIQVGDFGLFDSGYNFHEVCKGSKIPVYFIDGNHDDCDRWCQYTEVTRVWDDANLFYVPRGTVMELDKRTIAFMGGAASIDKQFRLREGWHWTEKENITPEEIQRLMDNAKDKTIDMLITHCPPNSVIEQHFDPLMKLQFGVSVNWKDPNQDIIENIWKSLGYPNIYSGHMHKNINQSTYCIINIDATLIV
jgi:Icc-related predicted phosphoesterase